MVGGCLGRAWLPLPVRRSTRPQCIRLVEEDYRRPPLPEKLSLPALLADDGAIVVEPFLDWIRNGVVAGVAGGHGGSLKNFNTMVASVKKKILRQNHLLSQTICVNIRASSNLASTALPTVP
jgi:hypothetical protein